MDPENNEQTELLRLIWGEMKALGANLGARIDRTNERLEQLATETRAGLGRLDTRLRGVEQRLDVTNERLDVTNERLAVVEVTLKDLAGQQLMLGRFVKHVVERHDGEIDDLRIRVTRLESG